MGNADGFHLVLAVLALFLVTGCHQDRIVYGSTQLDGTDDDAGHERKADALIVWDCHIDHDRKLDNGHQNDRQGNRLEDDQDDHKNRCD